MTVTTAEQNRVAEGISEEGPISHGELCDKTEYEWDELQEIIRSLRNNGRVEITIDRRYSTV